MKTPIAVRNNNPLNIRFTPMNNWLGQSGEEKGFCTFKDLNYGCRAALFLLNAYIKRGYDTIPKIISRWAPASENNTKAYIDYVVNHVAFDIYDAPDAAAYALIRDMRISTRFALLSIASAMAHVEIGRAWLSRSVDYSSSLTGAFKTAADMLNLQEEI